MRQLIFLVCLSAATACQKPLSKEQILQNKIDSLELKIASAYTPGFGEFMTAIQAHHSKLWFAGKSQNWKLAAFEIKEIRETLDAIKQYETARPETKTISMMMPALERTENAISQKNDVLFTGSFVNLTNTCNNCHLENNFEFNVVKIPATNVFSNQEFSIEAVKE